MYLKNMSLNGYRIYLAGPVEMAGDCASWRTEVARMLKGTGAIVWDPLIKPDKGQFVLPYDLNNYGIKEQSFDKDRLRTGALSHSNSESLNRLDILRKVCLNLAAHADLVICRVNKEPTVGTFEELNYAKSVVFYGDLDSSWRAAQFKDKALFNTMFVSDIVALKNYLAKIESDDCFVPFVTFNGNGRKLPECNIGLTYKYWPNVSE